MGSAGSPPSALAAWYAAPERARQASPAATSSATGTSTTSGLGLASGRSGAACSDRRKGDTSTALLLASSTRGAACSAAAAACSAASAARSAVLACSAWAAPPDVLAAAVASDRATSLLISKNSSIAVQLMAVYSLTNSDDRNLTCFRVSLMPSSPVCCAKIVATSLASTDNESAFSASSSTYVQLILLYSLDSSPSVASK
mmetsp:Transcript_14665/g.47943  ORF Transcript_14665/g.47943 Transcript_14665/m.47943 type:complete len:201 (-) Transcript_14665:316-918(-)